ncbi:MAG: hypothetical protein MZV70_64440 [Desulfobacterales bacterium]|nr:hypothetical protein [Desulfobacterales bacterium]
MTMSTRHGLLRAFGAARSIPDASGWPDLQAVNGPEGVQQLRVEPAPLGGRWSSQDTALTSKVSQARSDVDHAVLKHQGRVRRSRRAMQ